MNARFCFTSRRTYSQFVGGVSIAALFEGIKSGDFVNSDIIVANITGTGRNRIEDEIESLGKEFGLEEMAKNCLALEG